MAKTGYKFNKNGLTLEEENELNRLNNKFFKRDSLIELTKEITSDPDYKRLDELVRKRMVHFQKLMN